MLGCALPNQEPTQRTQPTQPTQLSLDSHSASPGHSREQREWAVYDAQLCFFHLVSGSVARPGAAQAKGDSAPGAAGSEPSLTPLPPTHPAAPLHSHLDPGFLGKCMELKGPSCSLHLINKETHTKEFGGTSGVRCLRSNRGRSRSQDKICWLQKQWPFYCLGCPTERWGEKFAPSLQKHLLVSFKDMPK